MSPKKRSHRNKPSQAKSDRPAAIAPVTLGCPKNLVDSERMLGLLQKAGYRITQKLERADIVLINTCGFLESARFEGAEIIEEVIDMKQSGQVRGIVVAGCMVTYDGETLPEMFPEVDQWLDVNGREQIVDAVRAIDAKQQQESKQTKTSKKKSLDALMMDDDDTSVNVSAEKSLPLIRTASSHPLDDSDRHRITERHLAYLKIAEGCDRRCSFCAIPGIRGSYTSKPIDAVVDEAKQLADDGVKELIVVAQDTTYYGVDDGGKPRLAELLGRLDQIGPLRRIRLMYTYPQYFTDELIDLIAGAEKVVPYIDLPLQHCNDEILAQMGRRVTRSETETLLGRLRDRIPELVLRTAMIVGFPGETVRQFDELVEFIEQWRFERLGVFEFSPEEGTRAAQMDEQIEVDVTAERAAQLIEVQQEIAYQWAQSRVGKTEQVLIDRYMSPEDLELESTAAGLWVGRTWADAPEVDPVVYVTGENIKAGQIVPCEIVSTEGYDLIGAEIE